MRGLRSTLRLLALGLRAELRNPGLWVPGLLAAALMGSLAWNDRDVASSQSVILALRLAQVYGIGAILWFSYRGIRDQDHQFGAVLRSKPVDGLRYVLITWATGALLWLALLGMAAVVAIAIQFPAAGMTAVASQGVAFLRAAVVVTLVGAISFALSRVLRSPLGGIVVLLAWGLAMGGLEYVPVYLRPDYSQNRPLLVCLALALMGLCGLLVERFRRGELRKPALPVVIVLALVGLTANNGLAAYQAASTKDPPRGTLLDRIRQQHMVEGKRAPGFWLPDGRGNLVKSADYQGKIALIWLYAADDLEAARMLPTLERMHKEFGERGVSPVAICLSTDREDPVHLARTSGYSFPILGDPATLRTANPPVSVIAEAYGVEYLPVLIVADRRRRVREVMREPRVDVEVLRRSVMARLAEEPQ